MMNQPTPDVSHSDVERVVQRDYPEESRADVMSILNKYVVESRQTGSARVQLAALKLAKGNLKRLHQVIEDAICDYRDVIGPAEYPCYLDIYGKELSLEEKQKIIDTDWRNYQEWLTR